MARAMCRPVEIILAAMVVGIDYGDNLRGVMLVMMIVVPDMRDQIAELDGQQRDDGHGYEKAAHGAI